MYLNLTEGDSSDIVGEGELKAPPVDPPSPDSAYRYLTLTSIPIIAARAPPSTLANATQTRLLDDKVLSALQNRTNKEQQQTLSGSGDQTIVIASRGLPPPSPNSRRGDAAAAAGNVTAPWLGKFSTLYPWPAVSASQIDTTINSTLLRLVYCPQLGGSTNSGVFALLRLWYALITPLSRARAPSLASVCIHSSRRSRSPMVQGGILIRRTTTFTSCRSLPTALACTRPSQSISHRPLRSTTCRHRWRACRRTRPSPPRR